MHYVLSYNSLNIPYFDKTAGDYHKDKIIKNYLKEPILTSN